MRSVIALLISLFLLGGVASAQPVKPKVRGFDTQSIGITQNLGRQLPLTTEWRDEAGKPVKLGDYFANGNPTVVVPVFYRCKGVCLVVMDEVLKAVHGIHGKFPDQKFNVVVFSIHPKENEIDAQVRQSQVVKVYRDGGRDEADADRLEELAKREWHFLTGSMASITELTTALGFRYTWEPEIDRIQHAAGIMVATPEGRLSAYFYGREYTPLQVKTALDTARKSEIGQAAQPILLGCFMMDPETGRLRPVVGRILQVGGITTVLILATSIAIMSVRSRQRSRLSGGAKSD